MNQPELSIDLAVARFAAIATSLSGCNQLELAARHGIPLSTVHLVARTAFRLGYKPWEDQPAPSAASPRFLGSIDAFAPIGHKSSSSLPLPVAPEGVATSETTASSLQADPHQVPRTAPAGEPDEATHTSMLTNLPGAPAFPLPVAQEPRLFATGLARLRSWWASFVW